MSPNRRIILNIIATYGRTLIGVFCGIFSTRWVLMVLGKEDFGLFGLVGSLVIFLSFLNLQFAGALSRFYAYAVGQAKIAEDAEMALEESRKWFSVGVTIHTLVPLALVAIGYPIGIWAIRGGVIGVPAYRVDACIWLWRFVCVSSFVSMVNVPFGAMYVAKQYIAELTIYSISQAIVRTAFIYYMTLSPKDWLVTYGFATCLIMIIPQMLICLRAVIVFRECRLRFRYMILLPYMKRLAAYAWWQTFGGLGYLARHQFLTVVVNGFFGPKVTASFSIGGTVSGEAAALTGALHAAFAPAITTAYGEGDRLRVRAMAYQACKFGTLLTLLFAIPMGLEMNALLQIWLKDVPRWANGICLVMLLVVVIEKLSLGHIIGVNASGNVARFQVCRGIVCLTAIPLAIGSAIMFRHVYAVAVSLLATTCFVCCSDVWIARSRIGLSVRYWLFEIVFPLVVVCVVACSVALVPRCFMRPSFFRIAVTSVTTLMILTILSWHYVIKNEERLFLEKKFSAIVKLVMQLARAE